MADKKIYVGEEGAKELYRRTKDNLAGAVNTINGELELKATKEELGEAVETIDGKLDGKASQTALETAVTGINTELAKKAVKTEVDAEISRIDSVLTGKANTSDVNDALALKENLSNKVTAFNEPTDTQYPSAALVHAEIVRLEGIIGNLGGFEKANLTSDVPPVPAVQNPKHTIIYLTLIPDAPSPDKYKEWIYNNLNQWEVIGDTSIDLTDYYDKNDVNSLLADKADLSGLTITTGTGTATITLKPNVSATVLTEHQDVSGKAEKSEMSITAVSGDQTKKTIQLKSGTSQDVLVEHQNISGKADTATSLAGYGITDAYTKTETDTELDKKVDKVTGKGLSTNDYTDADKNKLTGIETGAEVNLIKSVKVDGTALSIDANKAVNIPLASATESGNETVYVTGAVTGQDKAKWDSWVSDEFPIIPAPSSNTIIIEGKEYKYVKIGNQLWLAENLDSTFTGIADNPDGDFPLGPCTWYYNRDASTYGPSGQNRGRLYTTECIPIINNALPGGWHVPTKSDYDALFTFCGLTPPYGNYQYGYSVFYADRLWGNTAGLLDDYGLSLIPTGRRTSSTYDASNVCMLLTDTDSSASTKYVYWLYNDGGAYLSSMGTYYDACAVRLVKNLA